MEEEDKITSAIDFTSVKFLILLCQSIQFTIFLFGIKKFSYFRNIISAAKSLVPSATPLL